MADPTSPELFAAVDLGSNSFHMIIARLVNGEVQVIDRMKDQVQLGAGLDARGNLSPEVRQRSLQCLQRFGERLRPIPSAQVRVVGTSTLRRARNGSAFLKAAQNALGHPVEIISGKEEARVIYLGVAQGLTGMSGRRLVVDIGGGSTECAIGEGMEPLHTETMHMGCVSYTQRFFPEGRIKLESFRAAVVAAQQELEPIERRFRSIGWAHAVGSSGTIAAVAAVLRANGWGDAITRDGMKQLRKELVAARQTSKLALPGLTGDRAPIIAGGLAILYGAFKSLKIDRMVAASGALREGILYELVGRYHHTDVRHQTVQRLMARYEIDVEQAKRVEATALACLDQVAGAWGLQQPRYRSFLSWAALLHEAGLTISYAGHHKHGAYVIANSELAGFAREGQHFLAALVRAHRRRLRPERLQELRDAAGEAGVRLAVLLRLAVALNRSRAPEDLGSLRLIADANTLELDMQRGWLQAHPMTSADLAQESNYLREAGYALKAS